MSVNSTMLSLGTSAPNFSLPDVVSGKNISINDFEYKKALLVIFMCVHCPYVKHVKYEIANIGKDYASKEIGIVAISANDVKAYPEDGPEGMKQMAEELGLNFPFLYDEEQNVAKSYTAACTPDFFLFNQERKLVYRGQLDSSRPGNDKPINGEDLRNAIDALLEDKEIPNDQKPSSGCSIKWKEGNAPPYFG